MISIDTSDCKMQIKYHKRGSEFKPRHGNG